MGKQVETTLPGQKNLSVWLISLVLFAVVLTPRVMGLDSFVAIDEARWVYRSAFFWRAVLAGDFAQASAEAATPDVGETFASGVPAMWLGGLGLTAKYWLDADRPAGNLSDYLALVPEKTERISLDFYAWTRLAFVLWTSLFVVAFYLLLRQLVEPSIALLAALLLAFDPFFMGLSRLVHNDLTVCVAINLSLLTLLYYRWCSGGQTLEVFKTFRIWSMGWLLLAGVWGGLALATKPTALYLFVFVVFFLLFESGWPRRWVEWRQAVTEGIIFGGVALVTVVTVWPALWAAPVETLQLVLFHSGSGFESLDDPSPSLLPYPDNPVPQLGFLFYPTNWIFKSTLPLWLGLIGFIAAVKWGWFKSPRELSAESTPPTMWTVKWLAIFVVLFYLLLIPADTRDLRYALPTFPGLYVLAAVGIVGLMEKLSLKLAGATRLAGRSWARLAIGLLLVIQVVLGALYFPYYFNYLNPLVGGPWLAPHLIKVGAGEGLDHMAYYLNQKPNVADLTVATSLWDTFVPFYQGRYTKAHYDDEADYILIYLRQIQNRNPFPEFWPYFAARTPEHVVRLNGVDYAWLYPGPQLREVHGANFGNGLVLRGYRLDRWAAQPGQVAILTLVWGDTTPNTAGQVVKVTLNDESNHVWAEEIGPVLDPNGPSAVEGHYRLDLPADIARGDYPLIVSVDDISYQAGTLPVRALDQPAARIPLSANFGDVMLLAGADVKSTNNPGTFEIKLVWQARQRMSLSYTMFVHAVDTRGTIWGQIDRIPHLNGSELPTTQWQPGEWVMDTIQLTLKPNSPVGTYNLLVGVYDAQTGMRLPLMGGNNAENVVKLASITIPVKQ
ncbi:MAG: phospholipid carrier-dependent glycosyltransferase [Anaerolineae bacterium]|nr:phospholipid carrier-dependent glycosyltransferase [Anaerolineae bacterium]